MGDPNTEGGCAQYFQFSKDGGQTWTSETPIDQAAPLCPTENQVYVNSQPAFILVTTTLNQVYFLAWDGERWSTPQPQEFLNSFQDPDIFSSVLFRCRKSDLTSDDHYFVTGCDMSGGGDIWITQRALKVSSDWFPAPQIWNAPDQIQTSDNGFSKLILLADLNNGLHAFWSEAGSINGYQNPDDSKSSISYAYWDGESWSTPIDIIKSPPGAADKPTALIDSNSRLNIAWEDDVNNGIYFSWANASRGNVQSEWASPTLITPPNTLAASPDLTLGPTGSLYMVYTIPINENRGVYMIHSEDNGEIWSAPIQIFDGVSEKFEKVDRPSIKITDDGIIHVLWSHSEYQNSQSISLFYTRSVDNGLTWANPEIVTNTPTSWSEIIGNEIGSIQRLWEEINLKNEGLQYQTSQDQGETWSFVNSVSPLSSQGQIDMVTDQAGQPHLFRVDPGQLQNNSIKEWKWRGEKWVVGEDLRVEQTNLSSITNLAAAITSSGTLGVIYSGPITQDVGKSLEEALYFSFREDKTGLSTPVPRITSTPSNSEPSPTSPVVTDEPSPALVEQPAASDTPVPSNQPQSRR